MSRVSSVDNFFIFEIIDLELWQDRSCVICIRINTTGHRIVTPQSLDRSRARAYVISFLIFEFLNLEYGQIDTKIEYVAYVLDEYDRSRKSWRHSHFLGYI